MIEQLITLDQDRYPNLEIREGLILSPYNLSRLLRRLLLVMVLFSLLPVYGTILQPVWGNKPVLGYFVNTENLSYYLKTEAGLNESQFLIVQKVAQQEIESLEALHQESMKIIQNQSLSFVQKKAAIQNMQYNLEVDQIIDASQVQIKLQLDAQAYTHMVDWINHRWQIEQKLHGIASQPKVGSRTYEIFATRYDSGGSYYVALPDQCLKLTNGGSHSCEDDGYKVGREYSVYMYYKKSVAARVGEAGPWNIDDNYWATYNDPTPRRMFADLPLGMPEAQAAYFDGYNGGVDQYGRKVTAPFGIDLSFDVANDLGLPSKKNDWIQVSYLWTEDWGASPLTSGGNTNQSATQIQLKPVEVVTPQVDGSVIHVVKAGQTLWDIAVQYKVTLQDIYQLNRLSEEDVIIPGDEILVKKIQVQNTHPPSPSKTLESIPTELTSSKTSFVTRGASAASLQSSPLVSTPFSLDHKDVDASPSFFNASLFLIIGLLVILGLILLLLGGWINKKS